MIHFLITNAPYLAAVLSAFLTGFFGWLAALWRHTKLAKTNEMKAFNDRQKLLVEEQEKFLKEQNQFRQEIRQELSRVQDQLLIEQKRNSRLEEELATYKKNYAQLEMKNQKLQLRVHELETILEIHKIEDSAQEGDDNGNG